MPFRNFPLIVSAVVLVTACTSAGREDVEVSERDALVALFESTGGSGWINRDGWLSDAEPGNWYGVDTNSQGHVTRIVLNKNNLVGAIPSELGGLVHLSRLSLRRNGLTGEIPAELGRIARIDTLDLFTNGLSGAIPQELLGLEEVAVLALGFNQLSGPIPPGFGSMPGLQRLWLNHNNLSGPVPPELGGLGAQLHWLDVQENVALEGALPHALTNLTGLLRFEWGGTRLCSPSDEGFQEWLLTVPNRYGRGAVCSP